MTVKFHNFGGNVYVVTDAETGEELGAVGKNPSPRLTGWQWAIVNENGSYSGAYKTRQVAVDKLLERKESK